MMRTKLTTPLMVPRWLAAWSAMLALGWLLPNHMRPWLGFHADAWVAITLLMAALAILVRAHQLVVWHPITLITAALLLVPGLQFVFGLMPFVGNAWISSAYLLGLLLALLWGAQWEFNNPGQLGDGLFLAIGIASVLSVGLQLQQWLLLDGLELWTLGGGPARPHANLGQPNQLATLLLWGVLAIAWGLVRKKLSPGIAIMAAAYLLLGVALTASRTAWLAVIVLVLAAWLWRGLGSDTKMPWYVSGLGLYFAVCVAGLPWLHSAWFGDLPPELNDALRMSSEIRPTAYAAFIDAIGHRPWLGYGWNQVPLAQLEVAAQHPPLHIVFSHAHNLFLDLMLWCGIPLGLTASVALLGWLWRRLRAVQRAEDAVLLLLLLVVANHAMLELPLHYAYFLLPAGMVMGALNVRLNVTSVLNTPRWLSIGLWLVASVLLGLIIRDYSRIETSHDHMRFKQMQIKVAPLDPPEVLLLDQWPAFFQFIDSQPTAPLSSSELERMRSVAVIFPGGLVLHRFATALALSHHPEEARLWLVRACKVIAVQECDTMKSLWANQSAQHPEIAAIPWPVH
jgi:O-antigen ligase